MEKTWEKILTVVAFGILTLVGCNGFLSAKAQTNEVTPSRIMKVYTDLLIEEDYRSAVTFLADIELLTDEQREEFAETLKKELDKKGGLISCKILSEEILKGGKKAKVKVRYTWGDGTSKEVFEYPIKKGNSWYCTL